MPATAAEIVGHYLQRWRIEDFFRVLKSGCKTEFLLFRTADRLQRAIAINARHRMADHGHDPARPAGPGVRSRVDVHRSRNSPSCTITQYRHASHCPIPSARACNWSRISAATGAESTTPNRENQIMWQGYSMLTKATIGHRIGAEAGQQRGFEAGKRYMLEEVKKHVA